MARKPSTDRAESTPVSLKPSDKAMAEQIRLHYSEQGFSQAIRRALLVTMRVIASSEESRAA